MNDVPRLVDVTSFSDVRGSLGVVEARDLPFDIERVYYLFDVPLGAVRGEHGHKTLQQLIICMNGICEITLTDGHQSHFFELRRPSQALYVPPGMWRRLHFREPATVCCVLASQPYDKSDYIFSYEEFLAWVREQNGGAETT